VANRVWQVGLGSVFLAALATSPAGCGNGGTNNCDGVANACEEADATRCDGTNSGIQTCLADSDGCLVWTDSTSCGDDAVCDDTIDPPSCVAGCGDGECDPDAGETPESCPADCDPSCETLTDCLTMEWDAGCEGRWDCELEKCVEVCDYDSCGDDVCSPAEGENEQTCPRDCREGCQVPSDCYLEQWGMICQGRWNCFQGVCTETCPAGDTNCPDGVCWGLNGENEDSCFLDCLGGPCEELTDCFAHRWYEDFGGHWQCNPADPPLMLSTGACEAVEDGVGCGDATCDVLGGETPISCVADCSDYSCTKSDDCSTLTLPDGCGSWICSSLVCVPQQCD